jgi:hypothetical protein
MKNKINKIAAIFIVSIFALSGLGFAYAAWTETLNINGTITTGEVCWEFYACSLLDELQPTNPGGDYVGMGSPLADYTCSVGFQGPPFFWHHDKNVGWCTQLIEDRDSNGCNETLNITFNNVYPCYFNSLSFYVHNCGTIPIKVNNVEINGQAFYSDFYYVLDLNDNGVNDFEIRYGDNFGQQIEPGEYSYLEFSIWFHVLQDEDPEFQSGSFTFTISLTCVQWNEYPLD